MADRMVTLASNREIARECREKGLVRAQAFSWDRCAEQTFKVIQETGGQ